MMLLKKEQAPQSFLSFALAMKLLYETMMNAAKAYIPTRERKTYKVEVHKKISEKDAYSGTKGMSIYLLSTIRNQQLSL